MPTNLPPEYFKAEERYRAAGTPEERVQRLEEMLGTIPKHKGTDHLRADLRRKLSQLKDEATKPKTTAVRQASPYQFDREGAGQVVLIGPPNSGKSALLRALTNAEPEVDIAPYTTWTPLPGMMEVGGVQIQLIDTPPLSADYVEPQLMDLLRRADLILLVLDIQGYPLEQLDETLSLLEEQRIVPAHRREAYEGQGYVAFVPLLVLANKTDDESWDEEVQVLCELLAEPCPILPLSVTAGRNLEQLRWAIFERLDIIRVYAKPPRKDADLTRPFVLKKNSTVEEFAGKVHKDFVEQLKMVRVWGQGVYDGQNVGRDHVLHDEDIVELHT